MKPCGATCEQAYLGTCHWLTVHQVRHYWQLPTDKAAYHFLAIHRIAKVGSRGSYRVARRDLDALHPEASRPTAVRRSA